MKSFFQRKKSQYADIEALINYAIKMKLKSFKLDGFEFDLSGTDPKQLELEELRAEIKGLKEVVNQMLLAQTNIPRRGHIFPAAGVKNG